ncbi:MAG: hypothetical protein EPN89_03185 [Methylovulum sp.]|nr:MAG: hypothetical protein EPN89_03185 [Methylovulum sp.]
MLIKFSLLLIGCALALFVSADVLLSLSLSDTPERVTFIGQVMLLGAFMLLSITGLLLAAKRILRACLDFFSAGQRSQRRLLFIQHRQDQLRRLVHFQTAQINYFNDTRRKRLLIANNRKHIKALSNAITDELLSIKPQLSKAAFQQLQQENSHYCKRLDGEGLLKLQQKIATSAKS